MKEIELRAPLSNLENYKILLKQNGFVELEEFEQFDIMLDKPDASLFRSGQKIRIRIEKDICELTYKGLFESGDKISRRQEINVNINKDDINSVIDLFSALGFPICFQIKKIRKIFKNNNVSITFDEWPIIGNLTEIEGNEEDVNRVAIEIFPGQIFRNYRLKELFEKKQEETGMNLSELQSEFEKNSDYRLGNIELLLK